MQTLTASEISTKQKNNHHSFIKSWFFGMQQFSFHPVGIFSLKDTLKTYKGKKNPQALGFIIESTL